MLLIWVENAIVLNKWLYNCISAFYIWRKLFYISMVSADYSLSRSYPMSKYGLVQRIQLALQAQRFFSHIHYSHVCSWRQSFCLGLRQCGVRESPEPALCKPGSEPSDIASASRELWRVTITETQLVCWWNKQKIHTSHGCFKTKRNNTLVILINLEQVCPFVHFRASCMVSWRNTAAKK